MYKLSSLYNEIRLISKPRNHLAKLLELQSKIEVTKDKPTLVNLAIQCAELVLPIFENTHPNDARPRKAIEAAKAWLANPTEENAAAAYAAYAAAYAANTPASAAASAYAAASASAADSAYAAASAAAYAIKATKNYFKLK